MERIHLSEHFNYKKLFKFTLPSVAMMVFISIYGIVDGFFVSNFAGQTSFAALNLIYPLIMIFGAFGFMLGTGGNATVSKILGEGDSDRANRVFSMLVYVTLGLGLVLCVIGLILLRPVAEFFVAMEKNLSDVERTALVALCIKYAQILLLSLPAFMLQNAFQGFFVTAEKPRLGLYVTLLAGGGNILLDALFVAVFQGGLVGAAIATALSQFLGGTIPFFYFLRKNDSLLRLGKTKFEWNVLGEVCFNGSSELFTNLSLSFITVLFNAQLMQYEGLDGISAYGVMMYVGFIFISAFLGYSVGSSPIIGFHYGAKNDSELKSILKKSVRLLFCSGVAMSLISILFARPFAMIFIQGNEELLSLTEHGLRLYSLGFLLSGLNIFASSFFTALSNGAISLLISFLRIAFFQVVFVFLLPIFWGVDGIWLSSVMAELITLGISCFLLFLMRKRYGYM